MACAVMNRIVQDDNLKVLQTLANESVPLIYVDPPFNTGRKQARRIQTPQSVTLLISCQ